MGLLAWAQIFNILFLLATLLLSNDDTVVHIRMRLRGALSRAFGKPVHQ